MYREKKPMTNSEKIKTNLELLNEARYLKDLNNHRVYYSTYYIGCRKYKMYFAHPLNEKPSEANIIVRSSANGIDEATKYGEATAAKSAGFSSVMEMLEAINNGEATVKKHRRYTVALTSATIKWLNLIIKANYLDWVVISAVDEEDALEKFNYLNKNDNADIPLFSFLNVNITEIR